MQIVLHSLQAVDFAKNLMHCIGVLSFWDLLTNQTLIFLQRKIFPLIVSLLAINQMIEHLHFVAIP